MDINNIFEDIDLDKENPNDVESFKLGFDKGANLIVNRIIKILIAYYEKSYNAKSQGEYNFYKSNAFDIWNILLNIGVDLNDLVKIKNEFASNNKIKHTFL